MTLKSYILEINNNKKYDNYFDVLVNNIDYFTDIIKKYLPYDIEYNNYENSNISEAFYIYYSIEDEEVQENANEYAYFKLRIADHDPKRGDGTYLLHNIDIKDILRWQDLNDPDGLQSFKDVMMEDDIIFEFVPKERQIEIEIKHACRKLQENIREELNA